jgi:hypothetical protein
MSVGQDRVEQSGVDRLRIGPRRSALLRCSERQEGLCIADAVGGPLSDAGIGSLQPDPWPAHQARQLDGADGDRVSRRRCGDRVSNQPGV